MTWLALLKGLAPVLIGIAIGAAVNGWRLSSEFNAERALIEREAKESAQAAMAQTEAKKAELTKLDAKYTQELSDAQAEIDRLTDDLAAGRKRLRLNAVCESAASPGEPDAAAPRLNDSAERDYLRLRERISTAATQILGLQEYIRTQCAG
jgi:prophage endopeptidase